MNKLYLNFYNIILKVCSNSPVLIENIRRDFEYFYSTTEHKEQFTIEANIGQIPHKNLPDTFPWMKTTKFTCYERDGLKEITYPNFGKVIVDYRVKKAWAFSMEESKLHSIVYMTIRSIMGELLEIQGFIRVHALGLSNGDKGGILLAPVGGGKTTLALELLKRNEIKLISEDTPLIDRNLYLYPFPLRIGVRDIRQTKHIPEHLLRRFRSISPKRNPKILIDVSYFEEKIERDPVKLNWMMMIKLPEYHNARCTITKMNRLHQLKELTKYLVIGKGVCQGKEFFIKKDPRDLPLKCTLLIRRTKTAFKICRSTPAYFLNLSPDSSRNAEELIRFIKNR